MTELCTPRVNRQLLPNYVGSLVRVVGRVVQEPSNGQAVLETSDKQQVGVTLAAASIPWQDAYIEVIAKVNSDCSLQELRSTNLGTSFDMDIYNELVTTAQRHNELFA
mmetsp:Transcript_15545/g.60807  ORF Transcript_15545/g.60807 Transcript_15545/m.60807 type:complete len:108 (-) Transcript_15545:122-445(-)